MRVLIVEDSKRLAEAVQAALRREKYLVDVANDGEEGYAYAETGIYDVIIMDVMLPRQSGISVVKELRKRKIATPIIMLTALAEESDKISGLDCGADDYLTKPFSMPELLARLRALTRRRGKMIDDNILTHKNVALNLSTYVLSGSEKEVKLSKKEAEILSMFFRQPTFVIQREQIINKAWGFDSEFESNNLEVFISFLRKKLKFVGAEFAIVSMRGVGYRLSESEE